MTQTVTETQVPFEEIFQKAIISGLQSVLGDTAKVLSLYLDPRIAIKKPDPYVKCLLKCFPVEDKIKTIVLVTAQQLYQSLSLRFEERSGWKLSDYISEARQYYVRQASVP